LYKHAALVEYGKDIKATLKSVVLFRINPESLSRSFSLSMKSKEKNNEESNQINSLPDERISFTAIFDAHLKPKTNLTIKENEEEEVIKKYGIGPQLATLEKMLTPQNIDQTGETKSTDPVGDNVSKQNDTSNPGDPIPRYKYPPILFIWGRTRLLPVIVQSINVNEKRFDKELNPIQAEVSIELVVRTKSLGQDKIARGALEFTNKAKNNQIKEYNETTPSILGDFTPQEFKPS
jgi:hypothetical protein